MDAVCGKTNNFADSTCMVAGLGRDLSLLWLNRTPLVSHMRKFKSNCLLAILLTLGMAGAHAQHVEKASAIREVLGDGAKITTAVLSYSVPIDGVCEWLFRQHRTR